MNVFLNIKLIARNWWRNKLFFLISLFSLTAGLGCTNLLMTFFIHEYNVEKYNTDRNLIYLLRQDSPMEDGIKVAYSTSDAATLIKRNCLISVPLYLQRLPDIPFTRRISVISAYFSFYQCRLYFKSIFSLYNFRRQPGRSPHDSGQSCCKQKICPPTFRKSFRYWRNLGNNQ